MESRVSRKGKLLLKGTLPLKTSESSPSDKIDLKCEVLEVRAKNIFRLIFFLSFLLCIIHYIYILFVWYLYPFFFQHMNQIAVAKLIAKCRFLALYCNQIFLEWFSWVMEKHICLMIRGMVLLVTDWHRTEQAFLQQVTPGWLIQGMSPIFLDH